MTATLCAQTVATPVLSGSVLDPSGAEIPHAMLHLHSAAGERNALADDSGHFAISLPPASYDLTVEAAGFRTYKRAGLVVAAARNPPMNVTLSIATESEQVEVTADSGIGTDAAANKSALIFKDDRLDTFSDDPAVMQQQLLAIGGAVDPTDPPQLYVDGFSGGTLPPKESIREIRINQNPLSAQYDQFGNGRIEIFTKPGANQLHGSLHSFFANSTLNARNPFAGAQQPAYSNSFLDADLNGPLGKHSSFYLSAHHNDNSTNAIVDGYTVSGGAQVELSQAVPNGSASQNYSARFDHQFGTTDTFIGRYTIATVNQTNAGVGLSVLPSEGYSSNTRTQTLQLSDTHLFGSKIVSDSAFQYTRTRLKQDPNSTLPTLIVQGGLNDGGSPAQQLHDDQDRLEFQEYLSISHGAHFIRTGVRYRLLRDANLSRAGYNGQFVFPSLSAYQAQTPSQYSVSQGTDNATVLTGDVGVYGEDEWKATANLTLDYGLRFESQSAIPDHFDFAPRVGFAWSIAPNKKTKQPVVVLRGGTGIFYMRFAPTGLLQALRQNGVSQQAYLVTNPTFYSPTYTPRQTDLASTPPTIYQVNPTLHSPEQFQGILTLERSLGKYGSLSSNFYLRRGIHQFESRNINAPLPVTGVRPLGGSQNIYQYSSDGISNGHTFTLSGNLNFTKRISGFAFLAIGHQEADTSGVTSFVSNSYDPGADAGRVTGYAARQLYTGVNAKTGWDTSVNVFLAARSGSSFNITTGQDNNGDTIYNDRPSFATDLTRASVVHTAYGNLDTSPIAGQKIIPIDYGNAPALAYTEIGVDKNFRFGPRPAAAADAPKGAEPPQPRYRFRLGVEVDNVFNHVNGGTPIGVLSSPKFGQSISLNNQFSNGNSANRSMYFGGAFFF